VTTVVVDDRDAMHALGERLAMLVDPGDLVVLSGGLGAGKTTLTQGIGRGLGVRGDITSPTFVIARVHPSLVGGPALVHVDAYRLSSLDEVDDLDLDASFESSVTVVEWGEGKVEGLAESRLLVTIERATGDAQALVSGAVAHMADPSHVADPRTVTVTGVGPRWSGSDLDTVIAGGAA
jgi:tRNA threonylcarbamoyladenosine biosynthesis protein TsaE